MEERISYVKQDNNSNNNHMKLVHRTQLKSLYDPDIDQPNFHRPRLQKRVPVFLT